MAALVSKALASVAFAVLSSAIPAGAQAGEEGVPPPTVIPSAEVVRRMAAGESIDLVNVRLEGDLDLREVGTVSKPLRCHACRLAGSLKASDVVFERIVVFSGSTLEGTVELRGAVFGDRVNFDGTRFEGNAELDSARFAGDASLVGAVFADVTARGVKFEGRANFVQVRFEGTNHFDGAIFADDASFLLAEFLQRAHFEGAVFDGDGSFRAVRLHDGGEFDRVDSARLLAFDGGVFQGDVSLSNIATTGTVSLDGIILIGRPDLFMEQLSIQNLSMDVATVRHVRGGAAQQQVLQLIEGSAQRRGNLALANDARYRLLSLQRSGHDSMLARLLDSVFYRTLAGYLVRPLHPLVAIMMLLGAATVVRSMMTWWSRRRQAAKGAASIPGSGTERRRERRQRRFLRVEKRIALVLQCFAFSVATAVRPKPKPDIRVEDPGRVGSYLLAGARWVEFVTYKVLLALFLLALGNSYATIRDILDAVRG